MDCFEDNSEVLCYVCDGETENCEKLISKFTKTTCISFPKMISTLISDEFVLIVGKEDVVCDQCTYLVNKMDELQSEILAVRKSLSGLLAKKYQILIEDPMEEVKFPSSLKENNKKDTKHRTPPQKFETNRTSYEKRFQVQGLKNKPRARKKYLSMECSYCLKKFYSKKLLRKHLKTCKSSSDNIASNMYNGLNENKTKHVSILQNNKNKEEINVSPMNCVTIDQSESYTLNDENVSDLTYFMCEICNCLLKDTKDLNNHICEQSENCNKKDDINFNNILSKNKCTEDSDKDGMIEITIDNILDKDATEITNIKPIAQKVVLSCYICDSVVHSRSELARHILNHYPVKMGDPRKGVTCPICDTQFLSLINFMTHYDLHVKSAGVDGKSKLPVSNGTKDDLGSNKSEKNHQNSNSSAQYTCNLCPKNVDSFNELNEHLKEHNINTCQYCEKKFPSVLKLKEHLVLHEAKVKKNQCEYCLLRFNSAKEVEIHLETSHDQIKSSKSCPLCRKKCASGFSIKRHVIKSHLIPVLQQEIREKYSQGCDLVDDMKSVGASDKFIKSITTMNGMNEVENNINQLKMIVNVEASDVTFCLICGFSSKSVANLDRHREKHSIKKIPCPLFCDYLSCDTEELSTHLVEIHELVLGAECCPHCLCQPDEDINLHMKALHGKFYSHLTCHVCKEMFFSKENLKYHFSVTHLILTDQQYEEKGSNGLDLEDSDDARENDGEDSSQEISVNNELSIALKTISNDTVQSLEDETEAIGEFQEVDNTENAKFISSKMSGTNSEDETHEDSENPKKICVICRKDFKTDEELARHIEKTQNIDCPICSETIHNDIHISSHIIQNHPDNYYNFCFTCKKVFTNKSSLIKHLSSKCFNRECDICKKHFANVSAFIHHRTYGHRKDMRCIYCKKQCKSLKHLKYHERLHIKYKGKVFNCVDCGKTFQTPSSLKTHSISHTGNYKFVCEFCGRGFISRYGLSEHHASHTGDIRYCCEICGKSFRLYDTYHKHRRQHDDPFPAQCYDCGKRFRNSSRVAEHRRKVHTGERPYVCPYCSKSFNVTYSYHSHICRHTQVFPYNCTLCNKGFPTRYKFGNHLASQHKVSSNVI